MSHAPSGNRDCQYSGLGDALSLNVVEIEVALTRERPELHARRRSRLGEDNAPSRTMPWRRERLENASMQRPSRRRASPNPHAYSRRN